MAQPAEHTHTALHSPRVCFHAPGRCLPTLPVLQYRRRPQETSLPDEPNAFRNWSCVQRPSLSMSFQVFIDLTSHFQPRDKKSVRAGAFTPLQRELVFDIDMTDYDPVRTCCSDADICRRCWGFIACAVRIIDGAIREQFGFQHLLWVYSGRRGIHLWISDKDALDLTDDQRKAMVGWLSVIQSGNKETGKKIGNLRTAGKLPPALQYVFMVSVTVFYSRPIKKRIGPSRKRVHGPYSR